MIGTYFKKCFDKRNLGNYKTCISPKKVSGFWSSVGFKIGAVTCLLFFNLPTWKHVAHYIRGDRITHNIQSMVAKRGLTNRANVNTPM